MEANVHNLIGSIVRSNDAQDVPLRYVFVQRVKQQLEATQPFVLKLAI